MIHQGPLFIKCSCRVSSCWCFELSCYILIYVIYTFLIQCVSCCVILEEVCFVRAERPFQPWKIYGNLVWKVLSKFKFGGGVGSAHEMGLRFYGFLVSCLNIVLSEQTKVSNKGSIVVLHVELLAKRKKEELSNPNHGTCLDRTEQVCYSLYCHPTN